MEIHIPALRYTSGLLENHEIPTILAVLHLWFSHQPSHPQKKYSETEVPASRFLLPFYYRPHPDHE